MEEFDRTKPPQPSEISELEVKGEQVRSVYDRDDSNTNQSPRHHRVGNVVMNPNPGEVTQPADFPNPDSSATNAGQNSPGTMEIEVPPAKLKDPDQTEISPIEK